MDRVFRADEADPVFDKTETVTEQLLYFCTSNKFSCEEKTLLRDSVLNIFQFILRQMF